MGAAKPEQVANCGSIGAARAVGPRIGIAQPGESVQLHKLDAFTDATADDPNSRVGREVAQWVRTFLMRPHADLGRIGDVCPFTAQASRLDTIRIGICDAGHGEADRILNVMEDVVRTFDAMPSPRAMRHFKTIIVAFPNCTDPQGLAALKHTQNRLSPHSVFRGKMIGFFHSDSPDEGLINPDFRPMRSPVPLLAVRLMVEGDAPFIIRNRRLAPVYLAKFWRTGLPRLFAALRR